MAPASKLMRKNGFVFRSFHTPGQTRYFFYIERSGFGGKKDIIPSTDANDNCQPASNNCVGLISKRIIAANESVLRGLDLRRKKNDTQKTKHIMAALSVGGLGGTISRKRHIAIMQTIARARFINPAVLHNHQIIPIRIPRCIPERLMKCSSPVLRNAL